MENHKELKRATILRRLISIITLSCSFVVFADDVPTVDPLNPNIPQITNDYTVGTSNVNFSVNESGAAEFTFGIDCPMGGHLTPHIFLAYNSQNTSYGTAGVGINITGISAITRGEKTLFNNNGSIGGVNYDASDNLFLDGKRMILLSGEPSQEGATYCLEGDPYTIITAHGRYNDSTANTWFEVNTTDGKISIYGNSSESRIEFKDDKERPRIASWYLQQTEDVYGDIIMYSYIVYEYFAYPRFIIYGANSRSERGLVNIIEFDYEDIGTSPAIFNVANRQGKISKRISSITSSCNSLVYRKYTLFYNADSDQTTCKYARLTHIQEENGGGDKLPPTQLWWNYLPPSNLYTQLINVPTTSGSDYIKEESKDFFAADLNGDGVSDIVRVSPVTITDISTGNSSISHHETHVYISLSQTSQNRQVTYMNPVFFTLPASLAIGDLVSIMGGASLLDYDGDGYNDLIFPYFDKFDGSTTSEKFYIIYGKDVVKGYRGNDIGFGITLNSSKEPPLFATFDIDKNGSDDVICLERDSESKYYPIHIIKNKNLSDPNYQQFYITLPQRPEKLFSGDYNNDGLTDIIVLYKGGYKVYFNKGGTESAPKFSESSCKTDYGLGDCWRIQQGDFDGDGLPDFVYNISGETFLHIARNNGDGTFRYSQSEDIGISNHSSAKDDNRFAMMVYDIDGDGKSDVMICKARYEHHGFPTFKNEYADTHVDWLFSDGTSLILKKSLIKYREDDANESSIFLGDFNGDGIIELANYGSNLNDHSDSFTENRINIYGSSFYFPQTGRITSVTDGVGNNTSANYSYLTDPGIYSRTQNAESTYPVNSYTLPIAVVGCSSFTNGAAGSQRIEYFYKDFTVQMRGAGVLGFSEISKHNTVTDEHILHIVSKRDEKWHIPTETLLINTTGGHTSSTKTLIAVKPVKNTYFAYESNSYVSDIYGNSIESITEYDVSRGLIFNQKVMNEGDNMYKEVLYSGYQYKGRRWQPTIMIKTQKHEHDSSPVSIETRFCYDEDGNIISTTENYGTRLALRSDFCYDIYGNQISSVSSGFCVKEITEYFEYDPTGSYIIKSSTVPASYVKTFSYDTWGNLLKESDVSVPSNVLTTSHTYDKWGNRTSTSLPDGTVCSVKTGWGNTPYKKYYTLSQTDGQPWVLTWYDSRGHEVLQESFGPQNILVSKASSYNYKGQLTRIDNITGQFNASEYFIYDELGRVLTDSLSSGKVVRFSYQNRSVTSSTAGRSLTKITDAWGNVLKTVDASGGEVIYTYGSNGLPIEITSNGSSVHMTYDEAGNRTSIEDPDAGISTAFYTADGKIINQKDAKGTVTQHTYDELGRISKTQIGEYIITNTYGTSGNDYLRLKEKSIGDCSIRYVYDYLGRILSERKLIIGEGAFKTNYSYNQNRLSKVTFPGNLIVNYEYDDYGFKTRVLADGREIYKLVEYDGLNSKSSFCDSLTYIRRCDTSGYEILRRIKYNSNTIGLKDPIVRDLTKHEIEIGTLDQIESRFDPVTDNLLWRTRLDGFTESFEYDNLDRLVSVSAIRMLRNFDRTPITPGVPVGQTMAISYAPNGNITSKTGLGNYAYNNRIKPHAVMSVENSDGLLPSSNLLTSFNSLGMIERIEDENSNLVMNFLYGTDCQRWKSVLLKDSEEIRKTIYAGAYEKVTEGDTSREFYYLDGNVIVVRENRIFKPYLALTDHLGSILSVFDEESNKVFYADYDVWGKQTIKLNAIGLQRGYTGHEMLTEFGIINMNGRLYDPVLGRFFSPDNFVQFPDFTQSYNRYSYCLNNPLKYTDPSGQIASFVAFGLFNIASSMIQAAISGENVWKAGAFSLLRGAMTYGIGQVFGAIGSIGNELLRAGAHGLAGGIMSVLSGGGFGSGFAAGAISSAVGSFAPLKLKKSSLQLVLSYATAGGISAWANGGHFISGAFQGLYIGLLNHEYPHNNDKGDSDYQQDSSSKESNLKWDDDGVGHFQQSVICESKLPLSAEIRMNLAIASSIVSSMQIFGKSVELFSNNTTLGNNGMLYYAGANTPAFRGNQYVRTKLTAPMGQVLAKKMGVAGLIFAFNEVGVGFLQDYQAYANNGATNGYHTAMAIGKLGGSFVGSSVGIKIGGAIGGLFGGIGAVPGAIFGAFLGGIIGSYYGSEIAGYGINYLYY